jgi:hypothetical protein
MIDKALIFLVVDPTLWFCWIGDIIAFLVIVPPLIVVSNVFFHASNWNKIPLARVVPLVAWVSSIRLVTFLLQ